jgi:hypothetical protein
MNRIVLILAICGYCSGFALAMWALIPLEDLVQDTDVIVIGTLQGVSQYTRNGMDYAQGSIIIDEVVWGAANPGDLLTLKWQNQSNLVCPRVEHRSLPGRVIFSKSLAPLVIAPRQEFRLALDLRTLFPLSEDQQYFLRLRVKGFGTAKDVFIHVTRDAPQTITGSTSGSRLQTRPDISRLELLMPSLIAIIVSSIFVYRHAKELIRVA